MKKKLLIITVILLLLVVSFNGYKYKLFIDGKKYLKEKYPGHDFRVGYVTYDFLYGVYSAKVHCTNMDIDFFLTLNNNIQDDFTKEVNLKKSRDFISERIKREEWLVYVEYILGTPENYSIVENQKFDAEEIDYYIDITYNNSKIQNKEHFAKISY